MLMHFNTFTSPYSVQSLSSEHISQWWDQDNKGKTKTKTKTVIFKLHDKTRQ